VLLLASSDTIDAIFGGSVSRFVEDSDFMYEDFCRRGEKSTIPTFRASDFSWDDYGFSLGNGLYTDIGSLLDDKFTIAQALTYNTLVSACFYTVVIQRTFYPCQGGSNCQCLFVCLSISLLAELCKKSSSDNHATLQDYRLLIWEEPINCWS